MVSSWSGFSAKVLSKLLKKPNSCVFLQKSGLHIALSPKALNDIKDAIQAHLNSLVTKFHPELDAVVLGCKNVNILTHLGTILDDSPHVHIDIEAEFYLFKPEEGSILSGVVKKKSRDNIGCLVHDIFNASIPVELDGDVDIDNISLGESLIFCVQMVDFTGTLPYIQGKLIDPQEEPPGEEISFSKHKKRKRSDDHQMHKKIKTEFVESSAEESNFNKMPKHPTSILKKTSSLNVESSPARRISFYGDIPETASETVVNDIIEGKSKKKKKESETLPLEESPIHSKKKNKSVVTIGKEPTEASNDFQDSWQMTVKQKTKKTTVIKENEGENEIWNTEEPSQHAEDFCDIQPKKKRNLSKMHSNILEFGETYENPLEGNKFSAAKLQTKNKRKKVIVLHQQENETAEIGELLGNLQNIPEKKKKRHFSDNENEMSKADEEYEDPEQMDKSFHKLNPKKKKKAAVASELEEFETGDSRHFVGKMKDGHQTKKKSFATTSETQIVNIEKGNRNVSDTTTVSLIEKLKTKKEKHRNTEVMETDSSVPVKQRKDTYSSETEPKNKVKKGGNEESIQADKMSKGKVENGKKKKKKKKKVDQAENAEMLEFSGNEQLFFGKKASSLTVASRSKSRANSTILAYSDVERKQSSHDSASSFESLSPIRKQDHPPENSEKHFGFVTSTQIETCPDTKKISSDSKRQSVSPPKALRGKRTSPGYEINSVKEELAFNSLSPPKSKTTKQNVGNKGVSTSKANAGERKSQDTVTKPTHVINKTVFRPNELSDTDSSSSMDLPSPVSLKVGTLHQNISNLKTVQSEQKTQLKHAGSDSSSSESDTTSPGKDIAQQTKNKNKQVPTSVSKRVQTDESNSDLDTSLAVIKKIKPQLGFEESKVASASIVHSENESDDGGSTDSDLPSHMQKKRKKLSPSADIAVKNANQQTSIFPPSAPIAANFKISPLTSVANVHQKATRKTAEKKSPPTVQKHDTSSSSESDIGSLPLPKPQKQKSPPIPKKKSIPFSLQPPGSDSRNSDSGLPSHTDKISLTMASMKSAPVSKRTKPHSKSDEKIVNDSDTDSIVKSLLKKIKSEVMEPSDNPSAAKSTQKVAKRANKKCSKVKDSHTPVEQVSEPKGKKNSNSKKTLSSKDSKKPNMKLEGKHKLKETPEEMASLTDKLLNNISHW